MAGNRICKLLNIKYPIIQAPMNWISGANLVAAVSNAGGLGTLGPNAGAKTVTTDFDVTGERLREQIRRVKNLTEKPFAVNIPIGFGDGRKYSEKCLQVVLEEGVSIVVTSVGSPKVYTQKLKDHGIVVMHAVSTMSQAIKSEASSVDAVICEGYEGGGHKGFEELTSFALIPMVSDNIKIPVIAGGGITDTRGVIAAIALGADGVYMGTRLMASLESDAHPNIKDAIVKSEDVCTVSLDHGEMMGRCLKNSYAQKYKDMAESGASYEELSKFHRDHSLYNTQITGDVDCCEIMCGQGAGLIKSIPSVAEIMEVIAGGIHPILEECRNKLLNFSSIQLENCTEVPGDCK